ncbi:MAG: response regulator [Elusimicrobiota bacterium]|nr:response regulator [Elusimicrobiota bacterium]
MPKQKILIVEDDRDSNDLVKDCLDAAGYGTTQVFSAAEAIECAAALCPDLVVLDINLPDGSGEMVYTALQSMTATKGLPVIVISGEAPSRVQKMQNMKNIPPEDILVKPLDLPVLLNRMNMYLAEKKNRSKKKILIVDDDISMNEIIKRNLESAGYGTISAFGGYQAVDIAKSKEPDLMLLDINLPAGSGELAYTIFKSLSELNHIPVIIVSGEDPAVIRRMHIGKQVSLRDIFLKPVDFKKLLRRISHYLTESETA